ncbi:hypothetical protein M430DRAFT_33575 [Amorphotheca resinae ATCC 22711]|uniref:Amino-acid N-acetyltransferase subunit Mak10 n=1 Tax=Amorphotheca resinae ATCC 22711 TaxID=857342 RepID=A0A2T3B7T9_AMORE|nr:hypothetical protein M430DRAFT_33575 [Amorphotheca resinae ATCC 22711]PSS22902.1 hypothetical protein M430DRAFT_33575 [Amorphotheca resinae ATCC 22711]
MHSDGVSVLSQQVAGLGIDDGPNKPSAFGAYEQEPPSAPKLQSKGVIAMDITEQFTNAAQKLDVGQLIKDPDFTLFESVGALEIMDPKMDSGFLEPGETMEDDYDFSQALLPEEIIGIIDQLLCHEMAWHMGYPLSQTIFTSLYIDRLLMPTPTSLEQTYFDKGGSCSVDEPLTLQVLRAYCLGLIKTCWFVNNRVRSEHYYEEEDFVTHTYNRSLLDRLDHEQILKLLEETIELLSGSDKMLPEVKSALSCRLRFRAKFLRTVEMAPSRTTPGLKAVWNELLDFLPELKLSSKLGKPVPKSFSVKVQRKLASTVPPRPIAQVSQEAAFDHLERLCRDASVVVEVLEYHDSHSLFTFVMLFQARKPQPSVYVRTLLQHYLFGDMIILGTMSIRQIIDEDLASTVLPANKLLDRGNDDIEVPTDPRFNMASRMELFRSRAAGTYLDILRTICQNRCRIRRTLCHTISDWDNLQLDAEEIDQDLRQFTKEEPIVDRAISSEPIYAFPLSSWAYFYKLRQMEWIVQMGFELEIYQPDELPTMYWYLQYLAKTRARHLERIRACLMRNVSASRSRIRTTQGGDEYTTALAFNNFSTLEAAATYGFADALSSLFAVLARLSLLPVLPRPYSDAATRYDVRMKPFLSISLPEPIPPAELEELVAQPRESPLALLSFAAESVAAAKRAFEILAKLGPAEAFCQGYHEGWAQNVRESLKACIFAGVSIAAVKRAVEATGGKGQIRLRVDIPKAGERYHDWWVVPKVVPLA